MNSIQHDFQASEFNMRTLFDVWYETDGKITKVEKI